jgi:hypothetical protein
MICAPYNPDLGVTCVGKYSLNGIFADVGQTHMDHSAIQLMEYGF